MLLHGIVRGEKDNSGQALHNTPCAGCDKRLYGYVPGSDLNLPEPGVSPSGVVQFVAVSGTQAPEGVGEQLECDKGCYPLPR